jgi:hypothetical protein
MSSTEIIELWKKGFTIKQIMNIFDNEYIPKQKVKDKIEELKNEYDEILSEYGNLDTDIVINVPNKNVRKYIDELVIKILVLQELLEGGK